MSIGKWSYGTYEIIGSGEVSVGKFCSLASNIKVILNLDHRTDWVTTYPFGHINTGEFNFDGLGLGHPKTNGPVTIENDVWIGMNVTIMSGVTIGNGSVIAAHSHVVKDVMPYSIVGGNPAKHIKFRFTDEQINKLLEIKWWDWDEDRIRKNLHLFCQPDINKFISEHE